MSNSIWHLVSSAVLSFTVSGCAVMPPLHARLEHNGTLRCYPELSPPEGKATCEISSAARVGNTVVFANDKPIDGIGKSPVFSYPLITNNDSAKPPFSLGEENIIYLTAKPLQVATKYESLTVTPDGGWVIAATAFDRYKPGKENYNMLLAWPQKDWNAAYMVTLEGAKSDSANSVISLRKKLADALGGPKYFKIEGLTTIPAESESDKAVAKSTGKLLFGVREVGESFESPKYVIKIIQASYFLGEDKRLHLKDDFKLVADYTGKLAQTLPAAQQHDLALSSMEFDQDRQVLYLLTSYEEDKGENPKPDSIGTFLWVLPLADLYKAEALPQLIQYGVADCPIPRQGRENSTCPFAFKAHKAEGLALLGKNRVLVVFDDDRIVTKLQPEDGHAERDRKVESETGYQIIELKP